MKLRLGILMVCFFAAGNHLLFRLNSVDALQVSTAPKACAFGCNSQSSAAASPYHPFEKTRGDMPSTISQRWHLEHERNRNYGESWFFLVNANQGGILFANISITNLGLRTFDSIFDVRFYAPEGQVFKLHRDYRRKDISTTGDGLDLTIDGNRLMGTESTYQLSINDAQFQLDLTLERALPAFKFGNGRVTFYEDRSAEWNIGFDLPRAFASGSLKAGDKKFSLAGDGYHDHTWSTIKLPTFMEEWYTLRFYQGRFSIILHQIHLNQKFGGGLLCAGLIGNGDNLIPTRSFLYKPLKWREETTSGLTIPTELELCIKTSKYSITGTIKEVKFLDAIDILGQLAWPIKKLIQSFYTKPYLIRYLARCDFNVVDRDGLQHHLMGFGVVGMNSY